MSKAMYKIQLPNGKMQPFVLDIGKRKKLSMTVVENKLVVRVPNDCSNKIINDFICSNSDWIERVLNSSNSVVTLPKTYEQGEQISILGNVVTINYVDSDKYFTPYIKDNCLDVAIEKYSTKEYCIRQIEDFISKLACDEITESIKRLSAVTELKPSKVTIKSMTSRWGSCSVDGKISMNYKLVQFPKKYIDYVCVHELCHLKHMNHSGAFWALVEVYCPEWKAIRSAMKM